MVVAAKVLKKEVNKEIKGDPHLVPCIFDVEKSQKCRVVIFHRLNRSFRFPVLGGK